MANFSTHVSTAATAGVAFAGLGMSLNLWPLAQIPAMVLLVTLGGIMPDIDADKSRSVRVIFTVLAVVAAFAGFGVTQGMWPLPHVLALALALYVGVRDVVGLLFRMMTRHRASWHSLLAVAAVTLSTVTISFRCFGQPARLAWSHGFAMGSGMMVHLILDECFSIDLEGARLKRSFGTALKLFDYRRPVATALMSGATLLLLPWLPAYSL